VNVGAHRCHPDKCNWSSREKLLKKPISKSLTILKKRFHLGFIGIRNGFRPMNPSRSLSIGLLLTALGSCAPDPRPPGLSAEVAAAAHTGAVNIDSVALMRRQGELFARRPFLPGNRVELLVDGPATFSAMSEAIRAARSRIDMESYEFDNQAGAQFAAMLLAARSRGVAVNLIYDAWGAADTRAALFDRLRAGGVQVLEYNPIGTLQAPTNVNHRDHRKLLCVDGRICITGGVNISKVYENAPAPVGTDADNQAWRDTDVRIEGPVAAQFEQFFMETWRAQHGSPIALPPQPPITPAGDTVVQAIDGAPEDGQPLIYRTLLASIALARHSVHLTTGFFVPTPDMSDALAAAARRGVDVQIIVPSQSDSKQAVWAGRAKYGPLLEAGVRIHERLGRILHAKTAVIDGAWSAVGSSNLDWRSAIWNNEIDAIVLGTTFGRQMEALFQDDLAASHAITLPSWRRRGPIQRFQELRAVLLSRLL
jgi:cardiolipin synthase